MQSSNGLPEAIVPTPAFEMYSVFVKAAGGRVVSVPPKPDFAFQLRDVCEAISDRTRMIFLTNPNNPTGQLIPRDAIREIARCAPPEVTIVIDEAYYDFCGETFLTELGAHPNVVIGRTFAKAHGLAGLRAGCLDRRSRAARGSAQRRAALQPQRLCRRRMARGAARSRAPRRGIARRCRSRAISSTPRASGSGFPTGRAPAISC